jgi:hypothetical protein
MKTPPPWQDEKRRLEVLWQYEVLDTPPEEVFDNLTALAAQICKAPVALISLVDENRQWFKSKAGLTASETARDISFCGCDPRRAVCRQSPCHCRTAHPFLRGHAADVPRRPGAWHALRY